MSREAGIFCFTSAAGIANSAAGSTKIRSAPYNFPYAGGVWDGKLNRPDSNGNYWSRTVYSDDSRRTYTLWIDNSNVAPADTSSRYDGLSIRCVATSS